MARESDLASFWYSCWAGLKGLMRTSLSMRKIKEESADERASSVSKADYS
jgi:hypothetical protein